jgi:hypothetical protein
MQDTGSWVTSMQCRLGNGKYEDTINPVRADCVTVRDSSKERSLSLSPLVVSTGKRVCIANSHPLMFFSIKLPVVLLWSIVSLPRRTYLSKTMQGMC